jgi:hypothetical protein
VNVEVPADVRFPSLSYAYVVVEILMQAIEIARNVLQ